ncbi:MAG: NAD(P)H-hydrate dehydratase [Pseudoruegeria sp.]
MSELLTSAQMRASEQAAIGRGEITGLELMERAGQGVVDAIFEMWPELETNGEEPIPAPSARFGSNEVVQQAVVICGPGNNGGDGFVVARLLRQRGWEVDAYLYGDTEKLPPDARSNYERWSENNETRPFEEFGDCTETPPDLIVDAVFGTGVSRDLPRDLALVLGAFNVLKAEFGTRSVSVDIPSGLCSDTGENFRASTVVDLTVTFHAAKLGHVLKGGARQSGRLVVKDIGLTTEPVIARGDVVRWIESVSGRPLGKSVSLHKFSNGHAFVLSGGGFQTGAARLAARGALRIGAGLVTIGAPRESLPECAAQSTAVMLKHVETGSDLAVCLADERINAVCLGPGLGLERARKLVPIALGAGERSTVLDADALSAYAETPDKLFDILNDRAILTPHGGEFARLFPDLYGKLNASNSKGPAYSKIEATRDAAARAGCVVLYKGADTVIAAPDGRCSVHAALHGREAPWLATAGSGDVLAGYITGLLARGLDSMTAAETAAWLHVECARIFGPGLIAEDLPEQLPKVFSNLGL